MKIFELKAPFVTPRDIVLTPMDAYGVRQGELYSAFHKARPPMNSTRTTFANLKSDKRIEALSPNEARVLYALMFHPYVLEFREQYAFCDDEVVERARQQGRRVRRPDTTTVDVVVTYVTPDSRTPQYHIVSVKGPEYEATEKDLRREHRERLYAQRLGWTWELLRGDEVTEQHYTNCRVLYHMVRNTDIWSLYDRAGDFSVVLLRGSRRGTADTVVGRAARKLGVALADGYHLFATGVAFGFLRLEPTAPFERERPIFLQGDRGWTPRPESVDPMDLLRSWAWI